MSSKDLYDMPVIPPVRYPTSDGEPMAETDLHWRQITLLRYGIELKMRSVEDAYVGSGLFVYYVEDDSRAVVAPDVFVTLGVPRGDRRNYLVWKEGRAPDVVFEISSKSTSHHDLGSKKGLYEFLGIREYFLIDPAGEYLTPPLQGFVLSDAGYVPMIGNALTSEILGLTIRKHGDYHRLVDTISGDLLPTPEEAFERAEQEHERAEQEHERAEREHERAEQEHERAERERARAEAAEAELERLRQMLGE